MFYDDHIKRAVRRAAGFDDLADFRGIDAACARQLIRLDDNERMELAPLGALYLVESGQVDHATPSVRRMVTKLARQA
jgi:hypothetical protein